MNYILAHILIFAYGKWNLGINYVIPMYINPVYVYTWSRRKYFKSSQVGSHEFTWYQLLDFKHPDTTFVWEKLRANNSNVECVISGLMQ